MLKPYDYKATSPGLEFKVGEGLTADQTKTAYQKITEPDYNMIAARDNSLLGIVKNTVKDLGSKIKSEFTVRSEPVEVRRMFEETPVKTKAPPIVTQLGGLGYSLVEVIPKFAATLYGETVAPDRKTGNVNIGINAKRLGYEESTYPTAARQVQDQIISGTPPAIAALSVISNKTLDLAFGAQLTTQLLSTIEKQLLKGGIESHIGSWETLGKPATIEEAQANKIAQTTQAFQATKDLDLATRERVVSKVNNTLNNSLKILNERGIPTLADQAKIKLADVSELLSRETPIRLFTRDAEGNLILDKNFGSDVGNFTKPDLSIKTSRAEPVVPFKQLPGYRVRPGQAPAFGLSTQEVESVGGASRIPKDLEPLAAEARKYKSAEEFVQTKNPIPDGGFISRDQQERWGRENDKLRSVYNGEPLNTPLAIKSALEKLPKEIEYQGKKYIKGGIGEVKDFAGNLKRISFDLVSPKIGQKDITLSGQELTDFYNKAVGKNTAQAVESAAERAKAGEEFGPRNQNLSDFDRLISENKVRIISQDGNDVYQYKNPKGNWINAADEDTAVLKATREPTIPSPPKPKVYAPSDQEKLDFNKAQLENVRENLVQHPAKPLLPFLKEGDFQDFRNPELAKTPAEAEKIKAKNKEIMKIAENAFADNPELHDKFDNPDTVREVIENYQNLRDVEKTLLATKKDLVENIAPLLDEEAIQKQDLKNKKDMAVQERRKQLEKAQRKVDAEYVKEVERRAKINSEIIKPPDSKKLNTFNPKSSLDKETQGIYERFIRKQNEAKVVPVKYINMFPETDKLGAEAYDMYQLVGDAPHQKEIQDVLSKLYRYAQDNGFPDLPHRKNYLPQMYKGTHDKIPALEIRKKMARERLTKEGATIDEINKYLDALVENEDQSVHLKKNAFFQKYKYFSSYAEAREYGYLPKYEKMSELLGVYNKLILQTTSARTFIDDLASSGKIVVEQVAPQDWQPVKYGPQGIKGYWASPKVGNFLDGIFRGHENMGLTDTIMSGVAGVSKFGQNIALSGGAPLTSVNFFTAGILNKELMRGNVKAFNAFIKSNSNAATIKSLQSDYKYIEMMVRNGIPFRSIAGVPKENYETIKTKWGKLTEGVKTNPIKPSSYTPFFQIIGDSVDNVFGKKTFDNFLPLLNVQVFKDSYLSLLKQGVTDELAQATATRLTSLSQGILEDVGRSALTQDKLTALFLAPVYRESIINVILNTLKSSTTQIKNPAFKFNRHLLAGLTIALGVYNLINKKLNGNYTWENPQGHELDIRIPLPNGQVAYIPFMPGFLALPRTVISGTKGLFMGDLNKAVEKFGSAASMVVKTTFDVITNTNYFGNPIYKDTDTRSVKVEKIAEYVGLEFNHPYIKELINQLTDNPKPLYQSIITATELPVKFTTQAKENAGKFYDAIAAHAIEARDAKEPVQEIYNQAQNLVKEGKNEEAQAFLDKSFPNTPEGDKNYEIYKTILSSAKRAKTLQEEKDFMPTYLKIKNLVKEGKTQEARDIVDGLTDEEGRIYDLVLNKF